jgi:hypothetical protein
MGMYYCHGCNRHHDSKDGEYTVVAGKEYCDSAVEGLIESEEAAQEKLDNSQFGVGA